MVIRFDPELETVLQASAHRRGQTIENIVIDALRERFLINLVSLLPMDIWEKQLLSTGVDCGVTLPPEAVTSDGIYE